MTLGPGNLARVSGLHLDLDGLEARLAVCVVDVVAVGAEVQELPHADGALVANHLGHVVPVIWPHLGPVDTAVNGALWQIS
jgi:hypothetical protein